MQETNILGALSNIAGGITLGVILDYFGVSGEGFTIMTIMLILDWLFGLISAKSRGEKIESQKREWGLVKKCSRRLLPFIVAGGLNWTGMPGIDKLVTTIVGMIVFSELYSIIGHIYSINYKEKLPEVDAFKMLLNSIVKILKSIINKSNNDIEPKDEDKEFKS